MFANQVIWITGASSGIGEALAKELSRYGAKLVLSARRREELERVRLACVYSDQHHVLPLDLTQPDRFKEAVQSVIDRFGRIDSVIHNGGISQRSLVKDTSLEVDRRIMEVNFFAPVALNHEILPHMLERKAGQVVLISSLVGKFGTPLRSSYAASKHALHGYFESMRAEVWKEGINVLMVCPGFVSTQVSVNALTADGSPQGSMDEANAKGLKPEQCAERIVQAMQDRKSEVVVAGKERLAVYLKRFWPLALERMMRRAKVT